MAELKFDHTQEKDFLSALGMTEVDVEDINKKFASMSSFIIIEQPKKSELVEKVVQTFSYNELVLASTFFILDKTTEILKDNPTMAILTMLKDLKK